MNEEITPEFPEGKDNYCPRCYFEDDKTILRSECPHFSPAKDQTVCEHDYKNAIRKGRAKLHCPKCDQDITLELVFMHEAIDQTEKETYEESFGKTFHAPTESVSGEEWKDDFDILMPRPERHSSVQVDFKDWLAVRDLCARERGKEYERGREDRGEALGAISLDDFRKQVRNDTLDELEIWARTTGATGADMRGRRWIDLDDFATKLKANRDI